MSWQFYLFVVLFLLFNGVGIYNVVKGVIKAAKNSAKPK